MNIALLVTLALFYFPPQTQFHSVAPPPTNIPIDGTTTDHHRQSYWLHLMLWKTAIHYDWHTSKPFFGEQNRKDLYSQTFLPSSLFVLTVSSWSPSPSYSHPPHPSPSSRSATLAGSPVKSWSDSICARIPFHSRAERGRRGIFKFKLSNKFGKL